MALPAELEPLLQASAWAHPTRSIELVETHVSWVLLTGDFAYKIKRPVRHAFIDMRSLAERERLCREELRLNRRFAPELYLDVCAITRGEAGGLRMGGEGKPLEWAVKMRQFDRAAGLDALLARNDVDAAEMQEFGECVARLHGRCAIAPADSAWARPARVRQLLLDNLAQAEDTAQFFEGRAVVAALRAPLQALLDEVAPLLELRRQQGRIRECHGDLHARNVARLAEGLAPFDCLEFEPEFRWIDVADELALLRADLAWRGRAGLEGALLTGYLRASGDFGLCGVLRPYQAHRAVVRAKVAALTARGGSGDAAALRVEHDALRGVAADALRARRGALVLVSGLSGSGKSWLSRRIAQEVPWAAWISSDVERKRLAGLAPHERSRSAAGQGLYDAQMNQRTYERLVACADEVLAGGLLAIVDATFREPSRREAFAALAQRRGVVLQGVECVAPPSLLRERVLARAAQHADSEAGLAVLEAQLAAAEVRPAPAVDEGKLVLRTDDDAAVKALMGKLRAFC